MTTKGRAKKLEEELSGKVYSLHRLFSFDDADVAVEDTSVVIPFGDELPDGAVAIGVTAPNVDWTDGSTGTFAMDLGVLDGDDDLLTPTALDIDGGDAALQQTYLIPVGGLRLAVTITSSVDLDTATAGSTDLTLYYVIPEREEA